MAQTEQQDIEGDEEVFQAGSVQAGANEPEVKQPSPPKTAAAAVNSQARSPSERTEHPYHQLEAELHGLAKYVLGGVDQRPFPPANRPNRALLSKPRP